MPLQIAHLWYLELCYLHFWLKRNQRIAFCFQTLGCFMRSPFGLSSVSWWDPEKKSNIPVFGCANLHNFLKNTWKKISQEQRLLQIGMSWNRFPIYKGVFFQRLPCTLRIQHRQWHCCSIDNQQVSSTEMRLLLYLPWCQGSTICGCITLEKVDICSSLFIAIIALLEKKQLEFLKLLFSVPTRPACHHYTSYHCFQYAVVIVRVRDGQIEWGTATKK